MKHRSLLLLLLWTSVHCISAQTLSLVKDINPGSAHSYPRYLTVLNDKLYFSLITNPGKLYVSDGTTNGTVQIGPTTGNGTVWNLTVFNSNLYFTYDDGINGLELWKSDGTESGTVLVKDIWPGTGSSNPGFFTVCNGKLFFQASTPSRSQGLWVTDGTTVGTTQVLNNLYAAPLALRSFEVFNNKIYFSGNTGSGYGLWTSDGTPAGTQLIKSGLSTGAASFGWAIYNNKMYFEFSDNTSGQGLWVSDGTTAGTMLVKKLTNPHDFLSANNRIYFAAFDALNGDELWVSDGTSGGTNLVKDIFPGTANSSLRNMFLFKNEVYFFTYTGEFYKTDGTSSGTIQLKGAGIYPYQTPYLFNGKIYWFANAGTLDGPLYESDGTSSGTKTTATPVNAYSVDGMLAAYKGELYFPAYFNAQGSELCKFTFVSNTITITSQPTTQTVCEGTTASLTTTATGTTNLLYQWQKSDGSVFTDITNSAVYTGANSSSLSIHTSISGSAGTYRCKVSGDNANDEFTNSATLVVSSTCNQNQAPVFLATKLLTPLKGIASVDLLSLVSDVDNNLDLASLSIVQGPVSGAPASINPDGVLTIDYSNMSFSGEDHIRLQVCDALNSCTVQDITVTVIGDIIIYNAVSPNGDDKNEFFFLQYIDTFEDTRKNHVTIFNCWGDVVFETHDYNNTDRVFKGLSTHEKELVTGTYYYKISFESSRPSKTGFLYLKR